MKKRSIEHRILKNKHNSSKSTTLGILSQQVQNKPQLNISGLIHTNHDFLTLSNT